MMSRAMRLRPALRAGATYSSRTIPKALRAPALFSCHTRYLSTATTSSTESVVEIKSAQDFETLCVQASSTPPPVGGPVILDFYADWCEPCKQLTPKLTALVQAGQGAVRLAKLNVDNLPELAAALQIKSLPTVLLLHQGKIADQFKGMLPDPQLKAFVDKAIGLAGGTAVGPRALEDAAAALEAGDVATATNGYAELLALPEFVSRARAGLALCALRDDPPNIALAQELIAELHKTHPEDLNKPEVRKAISTVALAADAPEGGGRSPAELRVALEADPKDHAARFELAQSLLSGGAQEDAINELLLIVRRDKSWNENAARDLLLKLFDSLGSDHPLTISGRRKFANYVLL